MLRLLKGFLIITFLLSLYPACAFAIDEELTISTYYPSPYGSYNELSASRLAIGDTNNNGSLDAGDQPNRNGDIRLKPQAGDPAGWSAGTIGQFAYSSTNNSLYLYDGSNWIMASGGVGTLTLANGPTCFAPGSSICTSTATCSSPKKAISGGCTFTGTCANHTSSKIDISNNSWKCTCSNMGLAAAGQADATAICAE